MKMTLFLIFLLLSPIMLGTNVNPSMANPSEVNLDVPFEPNFGETCLPSSIAMVMRFFGRNVNAHDIVKVYGLPPFDDPRHAKLANWMNKTHALKLKYQPYSSVKEIKKYLSEGHPVIVRQSFSLKNPEGHYRVIIGFSDSKKSFMTNDPSTSGPNHEITYDEFEKLWAITPFRNIREAFLVVPMGKTPPPPEKKYKRDHTIVMNDGAGRPLLEVGVVYLGKEPQLPSRIEIQRDWKKDDTDFYNILFRNLGDMDIEFLSMQVKTEIGTLRNPISFTQEQISEGLGTHILSPNTEAIKENTYVGHSVRNFEIFHQLYQIKYNKNQYTLDVPLVYSKILNQQIK